VNSLDECPCFRKEEDSMNEKKEERLTAYPVTSYRRKRIALLFVILFSVGTFWGIQEYQQYGEKRHKEYCAVGFERLLDEGYLIRGVIAGPPPPTQPMDDEAKKILRDGSESFDPSSKDWKDKPMSKWPIQHQHD
jgi:hypothetical protein